MEYDFRKGRQHINHTRIKMSKNVAIVAKIFLREITELRV